MANITPINTYFNGFSEVGTETGGFFANLFLGGLLAVIIVLAILGVIVYFLWKIANAVSRAIPDFSKKGK